MKKIVLTFLMTTGFLMGYSQVTSEQWNSSTATYSNKAHKITWQLIEDLNWIGRPITSGSTLLKLRNDDTRILIKLGANKEVGLKGDVWNLVSNKEDPQLEKMYKQQAQQNGMIYLGTKSSKSQLCGNHAIKKRIDMKKEYPELGQTVHSIEIVYVFYKNNYVYTVSVMALSVLEEEIELFDEVATLLFNGFSIK